MTVTVLLVDDHAVVRTGLRLLLEAEEDIEVVGEAGNARGGPAAHAAAAAGHPAARRHDAGQNGIEVARRARCGGARDEDR